MFTGYVYFFKRNLFYTVLLSSYNINIKVSHVRITLFLVKIKGHFFSFAPGLWNIWAGPAQVYMEIWINV